MKLYRYVGPDEVRDAVSGFSPGVVISSLRDLVVWLEEHPDEVQLDGNLTATFVVDLKGRLRVASRRSEHVACAEGHVVRSAGEITFGPSGECYEVTNQSTGYCAEPESWLSVARALDLASIEHPGDFTTKIMFRCCPSCNERNLVKDSWFVCDLCGADLPADWNFPSAS